MKKWMLLGLMTVCLTSLVTDAQAQLDATWRAHGGLPRWRFYSAVQFDLIWETPGQPTRKEQHFVELRTRRTIITADKYTAGYDGAQYWVAPGPDAIGGAPVKSWITTPFNFFAAPFVFAEPGLKLQSLTPRTFMGRDHEVIGVTAPAESDGAPSTDYIAYLDRMSRQLRLVVLPVTRPAQADAQSTDTRPQQALVYDEWQEADRMVTPLRALIYEWRDANIVGQPTGSITFSNVRFNRVPPAPSTFDQKLQTTQNATAKK